MVTFEQYKANFEMPKILQEILTERTRNAYAYLLLQ